MPTLVRRGFPPQSFHKTRIADEYAVRGTDRPCAIRAYSDARSQARLNTSNVCKPGRVLVTGGVGLVPGSRISRPSWGYAVTIVCTELDHEPGTRVPERLTVSARDGSLSIVLAGDATTEAWMITRKPCSLATGTTSRLSEP